MEKTGAIHYRNVFNILYSGNDIRLERHRVNVVLGNFVQTFDIDDYFAFAHGRLPPQMDRFPYHKYGIPVLGSLLCSLHFSLLVQFIEFFVDQCSVLWFNWVYFNGINFGAGFRVYG